MNGAAVEVVQLGVVGRKISWKAGLRILKAGLNRHHNESSSCYSEEISASLFYNNFKVIMFII